MQPLFEYSGSGKLTTTRGIVDNCDFRVEAMQNGDIRLQCQQLNPLAFIGDMEGFSSFDGLTSDGLAISITGEFIQENNSTTFGEGANGSVVYTASGQSLAKAKFSDEEIVEVRFGVNNFEFIGEHWEEIKTSSTINRTRNHLKLQLDSIDVIIRKLDDYDERLEAMKASKNTNVTCEFIYRVSIDKLDEVIEITDRLCNLLSIAMGKRVNWIYLLTKNANNQPVYIEHHRRLTSDFVGFELIDDNPPDLIVYFLNHCYRKHNYYDKIYKFANIASMCIAIRSNGFLEVRCLALFSVVEYIVKLLPIPITFPPTPPHNRKKGDIHLREWIEANIVYYRISISKAEIDYYIKSRNSLVHEMKFATSNAYEEYKNVVHFLDKLVLRILDYDSYYLNILSFPVWSGEKRDKLTPTP